MPRNQIPTIFERWSHLWDNWHHQLKELKTTPLAACLSYPMSLFQVDKVVVGVDSYYQLNELIQTSKNLRTSSDWSFMASEDNLLINPSSWNSL